MPRSRAVSGRATECQERTPKMRTFIRRAGACWCGIAIALTGIVVAAPWAGAKTPVVASGSIQCTDWAASAKFVPPLVSGATGTSTMTFSGALSDCTDTAGVTMGKVSGSATLPTDCTQDLNPSQAFNLNSISFRIKWDGSGKFADTNGGNLSEGYFTDNGPQTIDETGFLILDGIDPSASGSFISSGSGILLEGDQPAETPAQLEINCTPKVKGQPGTGGLKKLTMENGQLAI
jgi:hypothetical protein